ncbi:MAG: phosphatidate cytidylyltransferase, partial [Acidobacteria bacterium]|nr:phosphatidate cytidylyltransferase [Acidobacteriota bacterium]
SSLQSHDAISSYEYVDANDGDPVDFASLSSDEYLQAATSEHAGLAAAIAQSADEDRQHAALHAALPGREDDIVGLDDVVDMTMEHDEVELATPRSRSDIAARVATGVGLVGAVALALMNPVAMGILAMLALGLAALEFYTALQRAGARPVTWAGLLAIAGSFLGTWLYGLVAVPIATILGLMAAAWFLSFKPKWPRPGVNLSFTVLGSAWIGGSGAFLFAILKSPDYRVLIAVIIGMVTIFDVAQYFSGRAFGKRQLSPIVSPKKTVAGLIGGYVALAAAGFGLSRFDLWELKTAVALVVAIGIVAPLGDLAVSVIKRALRIKDMGVVLPGHGGVLDRIDALLFAIPAAWVVFRWAGLV